jgi:hypothetical protein
VIGSQQTTVFVLDARSGALIQTLKGNANENDDALVARATVISQNPDDEQQQPPLAPTGLGELAIGRKDYVIRAVHPSFGEQWNVSWSQLRHISSLAVHRPGD